MAPLTLKKLTALQSIRIVEMKQMSSRLLERPRNTLNKHIIKARITSINNIWDEARKTHFDIISREDSAADVYCLENVFGRIQEVYEETLDTLLTLSMDFEGESRESRSVDGALGNSLVECQPAKLPRLDLPSFSGKYEDWDSFCDIFNNLVHNVPNIADVTKLQYLKLCLKGSAAELIKNVAITDANYESTWRSLKDRYHNPRLVVTRHLDSLMNLSPLKKESAFELRTLADNAQQIVRSLSNLHMPVDHWDVLLVQLISARLDSESRKLWESELSVKDFEYRSSSDASTGEDTLKKFPKFKDLIGFVERRAQVLSMSNPESLHSRKSLIPTIKSTPNMRRVFHVEQRSSNPKSNSCVFCSAPHFIANCNRFLKLSPADRRVEIRRKNLYYNCFGFHRAEFCRSKLRCSTCGGRHNTLIHGDNSAAGTSGRAVKRAHEKGSVGNMKARIFATEIITIEPSVLLTTARIRVFGPNGVSTIIRAFLDQGSQASLITESVVQLLRLLRSPSNVEIRGIGGRKAGKSTVEISFQARIHPSKTVSTRMYVLPRFTHCLPERNFLEIDREKFADLTLADPMFYRSEPIDVLIEANIYGRLLLGEVKQYDFPDLTAQKTILGWILFGPVNAKPERRAESNSVVNINNVHCSSNSEIQTFLRNFWTVEEVPVVQRILSPEDERCEQLFIDTFRRDELGRFVVNLPWKMIPHNVADETKRIALGSLASVQRKFKNDSRLAEAYRDFMMQYEKLGHMIRVPRTEIENPDAWYLPHHAVVQSTNNQFKIRVVFDASTKTQNDLSLNDHLLTGPPLQTDLALVLLSWRRYRCVFTADIVKMFRQIKVEPKDCDMQRIVWSPSIDIPPAIYKLTTVTYGTSCAPYLAIRTLRQLAADGQEQHPLGAECILRDTYVDDTFSGANNLKDAIKKRRDLVALLYTAGIALDKWASNQLELLPSEKREISPDDDKEIKTPGLIKTLGVKWSPESDNFKFSSESVCDVESIVTKRGILSNIARLIDPLGWLALLTIVAKILLQDLWILKSDWDTPLPMEMSDRWREYCNSLGNLSEISVPRWFGAPIETSCQIHGFCDASSRAYAAVIYLRIVDQFDKVHVSLLVSKSKVAPVKTITIPNLELCGAVLGVKLINYIKRLACFQNCPVYMWSDSQIVLSWLQKHPSCWKTFVANRISFIQSELPEACWLHVPSKQNPADLATRGMNSTELKNSDLWWFGPDWLKGDENFEMRERSVLIAHVHLASNETEPSFLKKYSSLS